MRNDRVTIPPPSGRLYDTRDRGDDQVRFSQLRVNSRELDVTIGCYNRLYLSALYGYGNHMEGGNGNIETRSRPEGYPGCHVGARPIFPAALN